MKPGPRLDVHWTPPTYGDRTDRKAPRSERQKPPPDAPDRSQARIIEREFDIYFNPRLGGTAPKAIIEFHINIKTQQFGRQNAINPVFLQNRVHRRTIFEDTLGGFNQAGLYARSGFDRKLDGAAAAAARLYNQI